MGREVPKPSGIDLGKQGGLVLSTLLFMYSRAMKWIPCYIHVFAASWVWDEAGPVWGIGALLFPPVPDVYVFVRLWLAVGFWNHYTIVAIVAGVLYALPFLIVWILPRLFGDRRGWGGPMS